MLITLKFVHENWPQKNGGEIKTPAILVITQSITELQNGVEL